MKYTIYMLNMRFGLKIVYLAYNERIYRRDFRSVNKKWVEISEAPYYVRKTFEEICRNFEDDLHIEQMGRLEFLLLQGIDIEETIQREIINV